MTLEFELPEYPEDSKVRLRPLMANDFEQLYKVASDPLIWEQHPKKDRYQRPVFEIYFQGAMDSQSAFLVLNKITGEAIGCSRYYGYDAENKTICIGYSFLSRAYWGKSFNKSMKTLMLNHAFKYVEAVIFHVGHQNIRSQKAMEKLGAIYSGEEEMSYYGEPPHLNIVYRIDKVYWQKQDHSA